ncbi:MAG: fumarate reductase subunit C [Candidatus Competibacteraceae bacterium]|nr:MAG: fumarate reductase subunit C [Candidatus Competibacteraceae bacterium]
MSCKPYIRETSKTTWYLEHPRYKRYMAREVTCIFILIFTFELVCALGAVANGPEAYAAFLAKLHSPLSILFNLVALVVTVYHSVTWFNVTPQAMPVQIGEEFVPGQYIVGAHYGVWAVVSLVVLILGVW